MKTRERLINGKRRRLGKNQQRILDILEQYQELTAKDIAEIIWARDIRYQTAEYTSVHRSLRTLYKNGLVTKIGGQTKWRKVKLAHFQTSRTRPRR
jgi:Fe2+ or Zn2+ uptake regulation protein